MIKQKGASKHHERRVRFDLKQEHKTSDRFITLGVLFIVLMAINALLWNETDETTAVFSKTQHRERMLKVKIDKDPKKKSKGTAIAVLLAGNYTEEIETLCNGLSTLSFLLGDSPDDELAPVLVFQGGELLNQEERKRISKSTSRNVQFPFVDLTSLPYGFVPSESTGNTGSMQVMSHTEKLEKLERDLKKHQATRFWISEVWKHPILETFDTVLKISVDSCFRKFNDQLPVLDKRLDYHARFRGADFPEVADMKKLNNFVLRYVKDEKITPRNKKMWDYFQTHTKTQGKFPTLETDFELIRKSFMQRDDVAKWNKALTDKDPFGVLQWGWSQDVLRFLTAAIFLKDEEIRTSDAVGYYRGDQCSADVIRSALAFFQ